MNILVYTCNTRSCTSIEFYHEQYNVQWCDKCETILKVLFLNTDYLFLGQEDLYMYSQHSITIHISSVAVHDQTEDMRTLYHLLYHMIWHKYDVHVVSLYFYMFHICDVIFFTRPSVLIILDLIFQFFQIPIMPGYQWWMYTFIINAAFKTTYYLVSFWLLF